MSQRFCRSIAALALALTSASAAKAIELPAENDVWLELHIDGFQIYSTASPRVTVEVAQNLESMRRAVSQATSMNVRTPLTTKIFVFRNSATFTPFREAMFDHSKRMSGAFIAHRDGNYIAINTERDSRGIVFHELMHYFNNNTNPNLPLWLDEGLAEVYSTFRVAGDMVSVGRPKRNHVRTLRQRMPMPFRQLIAIDRSSNEYSEGTRQNAFYAQSWALVHYLLFGNVERKAQLPRFMALIDEGHDTEHAIFQAFGVSLRVLEAEVRNYVRQGRFLTLSYRVSELRIRQIGEPSEMSYEQTLYHLGDLLAHTPPRNHHDAERFLRAALERDPQHRGVYATLGYLRAFQDRKDEAARFYDLAIQDPGADFLPFLLAAENILRGLSDQPPVNRPAAAQRARDLFRESIERNPDIPRAWAGLGSTYLSDGDPAEGIPHLEKSLEMAPARTRFAHNLVLLHVRNGDEERARFVIEDFIERLGDQQVLDELEEAILQQRVQRVNELLRSGRSDVARPLMVELLEKTEDSQLQSRLRREIAAIEQFAAHGKALAMYNRAVMLVNEQKLGEAMKVLDELIDAGGDEDLIATAVGLRTRITGN